MSCLIFLALQISLIASMATGQIQTLEGWPILQDGIEKLINNLEGISTLEFTSDEYMRCYTVVYGICRPDIFSVSLQVYEKYKEIFNDYLISKVLPSLREKKDEELAREMIKRWSNHKIMVRWLSRFFHYRDRYFLKARKLPSTEETGFKTFHDLVYLEMKDELRIVVISMINREREGEKIDWNLLKNALDIYAEMGRGSMKYYEQDLENFMLEDAATFYSQKASNWIMVDSHQDYMLKANLLFKEEKERTGEYLSSSSQRNWQNISKL